VSEPLELVLEPKWRRLESSELIESKFESGVVSLFTRDTGVAWRGDEEGAATESSLSEEPRRLPCLDDKTPLLGLALGEDGVEILSFFLKLGLGGSFTQPWTQTMKPLLPRWSLP